MHRAVLLAALALAACSKRQAGNAQDVDIGNAAAAAQGSVDNYGALPDDIGTPATAEVSVGATPAPSPVASSPGPDNVVDETPFAPDSAQGAANVVQTYYALLEEGKYRQAWRLWDNNGRASGMSAEAFAASFAKYRDYHATIGAPGRVDAGAGQRYVTVPVKVYGRSKQGDAAFALEGPVTLHRTADIDGATAEQKSWRISASDVRPRPGQTDDTPATPDRVTARYRCDGDLRVVARFDNTADTATLRIGDTPPVTLAGQRPASGIWYRGRGYELRGKGDAATLSRPSGDPLACRALR